MALGTVAKKDDLSVNHRGQYNRRIGRIPGDPNQPRFTFGRVEKWEALRRKTKVEEICCADGGVWNSASLEIAKAVSKGLDSVELDPEEHYDLLPSAEAARLAEMPSPVLWVQQLTKKYGVTVTLKNAALVRRQEELAVERAAFLRSQVDRIEQRLAETAVSTATLHSALDAFAEAERARLVDVDGNPKTSANRNAFYCSLLKEHQPDLPLRQFGEVEILAIREYWRKRPKTKKGTPAAPDTVRDVVKMLKQFVSWLNKEKRFGWRKPADLEWPKRLDIPFTQLEQDALRNPNQVDTFDPDELAVLWQYATPLERTYIALALNFGFGQMEIRTLLSKDVDVEGRVASRVRTKTGIYAAWKVWPVTVEAVKWLLARRPASAAECPYLFVTGKGKPYAGTTKGGNPKGNIANAWNKLRKRVEKDHPDFQDLSFNKLRKTAGDLVKKESDGETAKVFHSRGQTNSDQFGDVYTNRDFEKVFAALEKVWDKLAPVVFAPVAEPFPADSRKSHPSISLGTIRRIQRLRQQGHKLPWIAKEVGLPVETVRYWAKKK